MDTLTIPDSNDILLYAELHVSATDIAMTKGSESLNGDIPLLGGRHNRIAVGRPFFQKLAIKSKHATQDVKHLMEKNDFHLVSLSCSFLPDKDCKFTWAQLGVQLAADDEQGAELAEKPLAWSLFPAEVTRPVNYTHGLSISPELSFTTGSLNTDVKLFEVKFEKKWVSYEPQLFSFGYRTSTIAWQFRETREKDVFGDVRDLLLIIIAPQRSRVKGAFKLSADTSFRGRIWRMFSKQATIDDIYYLSD